MGAGVYWASLAGHFGSCFGALDCEDVMTEISQPEDWPEELEQATLILAVLDGDREKAIEHVEFLALLGPVSEKEWWWRVLHCLESRGEA